MAATASWLARGVRVEPEQPVEASLRVAHLGRDPPSAGPPSLSLVEQHCFLDPGQGAEEFAYAHGHPARAGLPGHQPGHHQGEHAIKGMDADFLVGPVEHRGERDDLGVLHLAEIAFSRLLGAVVADHLAVEASSGPLSVKSTRLPKISSSRPARAGRCGNAGAARPGPRRQGSPRPPGKPSGADDLGRSRLRPFLGFPGLAPGEASLHLGELAVHLGQRLVEARRLLGAELFGVGDDDAPLGAEDDLCGLKGAEASEALLSTGR